MKHRNLIINPEVPKESTSYAWDDERDGWEGRSPVPINEQVAYTCDHVGEFANVISAIKSSKLPLGILIDKDIGRIHTEKMGKPLSSEAQSLIKDVMFFFHIGYRSLRDKSVNALKTILKCKNQSISFDPRAGKLGTSNVWVRGTGIEAKYLIMMKLIDGKVEIVSSDAGRGDLTAFFEFNYKSSSEVQSWADDSTTGLQVAREFARDTKNNQLNRVGAVLHAKIPDGEMVLSPQFTDMVKTLLSIGSESESIRVSNNPIYTIAEVIFQSRNPRHVLYVENVLVRKLKNKRDISIVSGWLKKNKHII